MEILLARLFRPRMGRLALVLLLSSLPLLYSCDAYALSPEQNKAFVNNLRIIADMNPPYVWGGTDVTKGMDCSGYLYRAAQWTGLPVQRTTSAYMAAGFAGWTGFNYAHKLLYATEGHLVFYDWGSGKVRHVGATVRDTTTGKLALLHASSSRNRPIMAHLQGVLAHPYSVRKLTIGAPVQK